MNKLQKGFLKKFFLSPSQQIIQQIELNTLPSW